MKPDRSLLTAKVVEIVKLQQQVNEAVRTASDYPEGRFAGRGIVICGGGDIYYTCAWVCIGMLRKLGCKLPVEVWYRGPREMSEPMIEWMRELGAVCVDAYRVAQTHPVRRLDSWELKPFAIANSAFQEVLFLDADNVPAQNPEFLFDSSEYVESGALFWPDCWPGSGREWLRREAWAICGVPYRLEPEIESGQMLIDKKRCWRPLQLALYLNEHSEFFYEYFYGDKDTFHLAWRRAKMSYALAPYPCRTLGDSQAIEQYDFAGSILFQHRCGDKWSTTQSNHRIPGFVRERECFDLLDQLKARWQAPVYRFPEDFDAAELLAYSGISEARWFEYSPEGFPASKLELRSDLSIGEGRSAFHISWMVETGHDRSIVLSIRNGKAPTCFLRRGEDGVWSGRWLVYERKKIRLRPLMAAETRVDLANFLD